MVSLLNITLFNALYGFAHVHHWLDGVIIFCAHYVPILVVVGLALYLPLHHHNKQGMESLRSFVIHIKEIILVFGTAGVTWLLVVLLKYIIHAPRPFLALGNTPLFYYGGFDSFPSGHAAFFAALAIALWYYHRKAALLAAFAAIIIGLARIAAGVHFPIDSIAGWLLGGGLAVLAHHLFLWVGRYIKGKRT